MTREETLEERLITAWKDGYRLGAAASKKSLIKLEAWLVDGALQWHREDKMVVGANHSKRIPSEDKWVEVEE